MKKTSLHIRSSILLLALLLGYAINMQAQLKVGDAPTSINPNAILEMQTSNKGLLLPRVALTSTSSPAPLMGFVNGMLVFDTVTVNDVTPGMYYCDGIKWIKLSAAAASGNAWHITGNSGTDPAIHFVGTTDNKPLVLKTNGNEQLRITENGRVGIGTSAPAATLDVNGQVIIGTLISGNIATDSLLVVDPTSGLVKKVSFASINVKQLKGLYTVSTSGQVLFDTPASFTDENKISLYRNGVLISFTPVGTTSITSEIPCEIGDEIRIIQLL